MFPHSPGVRQRIFYSSGLHASAEQAARDGVRLMSSTLVAETSGETLGEVQVEQIRRCRTEGSGPADSLLIAIPTGMGVGVNTKILQIFAKHVAPALGWFPNTEGRPSGYPID